MKLRKLVELVDGIAPFVLAEDWDNVGLQVGDPESEVTGVLTALDVTPAVLREAVARRASVIVSHHPLLFSPLRRIDAGRPVDALVMEMIRAGIALVAAHTNYDSVPDGTNGEMADRVGLRNRSFLKPAPSPRENVKYAVFVPVDHVAPVIEAIASVGAGIIGDYSHCTFRTPGTGTYRPLEGANPFAGRVGDLEQADEVRLECLCPRPLLGRLMDAVRAVHPYEEVACDVFPLLAADQAACGLGLIGDLESPTTLADFTARCAEAFGSTRPGLVGDPRRTVSRVAICSGAGGEAVSVLRPGMADVVLTGEMNHHQCAEALDKGMSAVLVGHFESEVVAMPRLARQISAAATRAGAEIECFASTVEKSPVRGL